MYVLRCGVNKVSSQQCRWRVFDVKQAIVGLRWDVILDTPVVVLPRAPNSTQVLVAHLGRMSLTNNQPEPLSSWLYDSDVCDHYDIEIRDMNVYTLDIQKHLAETKYSGFDVCTETTDGTLPTTAQCAAVL
ncbi:hypothetical protein J6590_078090 [Homalodisca vitripennis]|nr:hypothetical protein J6590_078090 [Homalodisca vitripennis]